MSIVRNITASMTDSKRGELQNCTRDFILKLAFIMVYNLDDLDPSPPSALINLLSYRFGNSDI